MTTNTKLREALEQALALPTWRERAEKNWPAIPVDFLNQAAQMMVAKQEIDDLRAAIQRAIDNCGPPSHYEMLAQLRAERNECQTPKRTVYNQVCDALDLLICGTEITARADQWTEEEKAAMASGDRPTLRINVIDPFKRPGRIDWVADAPMEGVDIDKVHERQSRNHWEIVAIDRADYNNIVRVSIRNGERRSYVDLRPAEYEALKPMDGYYVWNGPGKFEYRKADQAREKVKP